MGIAGCCVLYLVLGREMNRRLSGARRGPMSPSSLIPRPVANPCRNCCLFLGRFHSDGSQSDRHWENTRISVESWTFLHEITIFSRAQMTSLGGD